MRGTVRAVVRPPYLPALLNLGKWRYLRDILQRYRYCSGLDAVLLIGATMWLVALLSCVAVLFLIPRFSITTISVWGSMLLLAMWCTAGGFGGGSGMNANTDRLQSHALCIADLCNGIHGNT